MKKIKRKLILSTTILSTILLTTSILISSTNKTVLVSQENYETRKKTDTQIGAFSNLESFDNDGFNGGVKSAATLYVGDWNDVINQTSQYSDDGAIYVDSLIEMYAESDILISAGFQVANAITGLDYFDGVFTDKNGNNTEYANSSNDAFVLLDDTVLASMYTNAASISFDAEGAGFLAGLASVIYTEYDVNVNNKENANIVIWGGMPFPTVYDYLSGFAQAITWSNANYSNYVNGDYSYKQISIWSGGEVSGDKINETNTYGTITDPNTWYTGGFDSDAETTSGKSAKIKSDNAIDQGASLIFPVAGGNTSVAEEELVKAIDNDPSVSTLLVGVDADITVSANHPELYIGTASKNLEVGGALGLWAMDDDDSDGVRNYRDTDSLLEGPDEMISSQGLTINIDTYNEWIDDLWMTDNSYDVSSEEAENNGDIHGAQLVGDIDNGGVSFEYSDLTGQSTGWNNEFQIAVESVLLNYEGEDADSKLQNFFNYGTEQQGGNINDADAQFIPLGTYDSDSEIFWILIEVIIILSMIILILLLIIKLFKKNKEQF